MLCKKLNVKILEKNKIKIFSGLQKFPWSTKIYVIIKNLDYRSLSLKILIQLLIYVLN